MKSKVYLILKILGSTISLERGKEHFWYKLNCPFTFCPHLITLFIYRILLSESNSLPMTPGRTHWESPLWKVPVDAKNKILLLFLFFSDMLTWYHCHSTLSSQLSIGITEIFLEKNNNKESSLRHKDGKCISQRGIWNKRAKILSFDLSFLRPISISSPHADWLYKSECVKVRLVFKTLTLTLTWP